MEAVNHNLPIDINGKQLELGHIVAVRYVWNSYAGEITPKGLYVGGRYHDISNTSTYQIIGHANEAHADYNKTVLKWLKKYYNGGKYPECPVTLNIYENIQPKV